jgi:hypothetical protein
MINPRILEKKQLYEERDIQKKEVKKIKKSLKTQKKSPKTKTKKLKPTVIEESFQI